MKEPKRPKGEREYKITKCNLGYNVYRRKEEGWFIYLEWLQRDKYTLNREHARVFYTLDDATNHLIMARRLWNKVDTTSNQDTNSWNTREKQSWSEF